MNFLEFISLFFWTWIISLLLIVTFQGIFKIFFFTKEDVRVPIDFSRDD